MWKTIEFKNKNEINKAILSTKEDFNQTLNDILKYWWISYWVKQYIDAITWRLNPSDLLERQIKFRAIYQKEDSKKFSDYQNNDDLAA